MGDEWIPDPRVRRVELDDPLVVLLLMELTKAERDRTGKGTLTPAQMAGQIIQAAHAAMVRDVAPPPPIAKPTVFHAPAPRRQLPKHRGADQPAWSIVPPSPYHNKPLPTPSAYQLLIELLHVTPRVWRRLVVRSDTTLADLHAFIQLAFGWEDYHPHQFTIQGKEYGIDRTGALGFTGNVRTIPVGSFQFQRGDQFAYRYDFGDGWEHQITVETCHALSPRALYPRCMDGAQSAPPEDSGGPYGYMERRGAGEFPKPTRAIGRAAINERLGLYTAGLLWDEDDRA